ncbi:MAG TPA: alpha/beta hydrolase [Gaiellaceae bacterium]|nr:alpha/beta hydrolase [Gaiellaceae bacterium]
MKLHVHEWGDVGAPPVVCLHGVTAHGERFKQLAEERWAAHFHVIAPDLRGHGRSGWEGPWDFPTHVADIVETIDALGLEQPDWVGHSFGGRLVLELAARHPERIRRAVLLDPAIDILPDVAAFMAEVESYEPIVASAEAAVDDRHDAGEIDRARALADVPLHHDVLPDGRLLRRTSTDAVVSVYRELATKPPPPETLTMPTLLVYAPSYGLVRIEHLEAYAGRVEPVPVPGLHMVMWSAFDETADAVEKFLLENPGAQR